MYYYIFDQGKLSIDKFERLQTETTGLLAEFKISGEAARVSPLRTVKDLVDTASQRGCKTLVACGGDDTFNLMLAALKGRDFILGFIPFDEDSYLAKILGLESVFMGVKSVAARRVEKIDLAKISGNYFISFIEFGVMSQNIKNSGLFSGIKMLSVEPKNLHIQIDNSYHIQIRALGGLAVNTRLTSSNSQSIGSPTDGYLDLLILERLSKIEILRFRKDIADGILEKVPKTTLIKCKQIAFLEPMGTPLTILGRIVAKFPSVIEIIPQRLRMIVGKNRTF